MSDFGLDKAIGVTLGLLLAGGIASASAWVRNETPDLTPGAPHATLRYEFGGVTYSYQETNAMFEYDTPNPDMVTRWVTYPAVTETAQQVETQSAPSGWNPTAQAPGLSTLAPDQIAYPTLTCLTNCE